MDTVIKTAANVGMDAEKTASKRVVKVGLSSSKKIFCYLLQWEPFKNDERFCLFHLKSSFRSQDI